MLLLLLLGGWALITESSLLYFDSELLHPFIVEKLPVRFEALWLVSLKVHVASALVAFPLCLALFARALQRRPRVHRWLGRVAGLGVLGALVPSGLVLALDAKGGFLVSAGFVLSGLVVALAMVLGVGAARRRDYRAHAHAMVHVLGQMSVAVSSRALMLGLDLLGVDPDRAYALALWGPVLASALTAELIFRRASFSGLFSTWFRRAKQHHAHSFASSSRCRAFARFTLRASR